MSNGINLMAHCFKGIMKKKKTNKKKMIDSLKYNRSVFLSPKEINLFLFGIFLRCPTDLSDVSTDLTPRKAAFRT